MKYKIERCEVMGYLKRFLWYISVMILIVIVVGCGKSDEIKEGFKEE